MSGYGRVEGDSVYCHNCSNQWDRAHGGLQCPRCESEHVEIIDNGNPPPIPPHPQSPRSPETPRSPQSPNPFHDHNPWAPDPEEDDITTFEFNTNGGGRGTFSFSSRSYTFGGGSVRTSQSAMADDMRRNFEGMLGNIMGFNQRRQAPVPPSHYYESPANHPHASFFNHPHGLPQQDPFNIFLPAFGQPRAPGHEPSLFDMIIPMLNPGNARRGDTVFSQEAFDRVMTQLMEQNTSNAPGPASDRAIAALQKKPVDKEMMGSDGQAECSICMDNLSLGDEVTVLPCKHWFHGDCVISWLREHDTCPHCRQPISNASGNTQSSSSRRRSHARRRRSSSIASPFGPPGEDHVRDNRNVDSPSGLREARESYYGTRRTSDFNTDRPAHDRRSSDRNSGSADNSGGGVTGWLRNRLPFS